MVNGLMPNRVLSQADIEHFIARGFTRVSGCFSRELARDWTSRACERIYCSIDDSATWPSGRIRPPESQRVSFESIAPRAWQAASELVGGVKRILLPCTWGDGFIINFGREREHEWSPPSRVIRSWQVWHKDGDFFRHFLDSPEQGLLVVALFSDIAERGGATSIACDSVGHIARFLAEHPEGILPRGFPVSDIIARCEDFVETTGSIGDVFLLHPFMLHSWSINTLDQARFIINPPVKLREPMCFSRAEPEQHSPVERAVLRALGVDRHEFALAHPREAIVPERLAREKKIWEERARQAGVSS
jgi:hypothetical protein